MKLKPHEILFNYWAYQFPHLTDKDLEVAKKYNLKRLYTPLMDIDDKDHDTILMGIWDNLLDYADKYLGYEIDNDYMTYLGKDVKQETITNVINYVQNRQDTMDTRIKELIEKGIFDGREGRWVNYTSTAELQELKEHLFKLKEE